MELKKLEQKIAYIFVSKPLLLEALTHKSHTGKNYERLELLGDAVLNLSVTDMLLEAYHESSEGDLSKARASIVKGDVLARTARDIGLGTYIRLGKGEERSGGRRRDSILACAMEAIVGAVYIDGGYSAAQVCVKKLWKEKITNAFTLKYDVDYKTKLQELTQSLYKTAPEYKLSGMSGPSHKKVFKVTVSVLKEQSIATGNNKKGAEQKAAKKLFEKLSVSGTVK